MTERVVVAIHGGTASAAALDWAIDRATTVDAQLELVTVVDMHWTRPPGPDLGLAAHERVVVEAARKVRASGVRGRWSTTVHHDLLIPGLLGASRRADLLVIGTHKPSATISGIHGTLSLVVAARTRSPLVVVPAGWTPNGGPVVVGVDDRSGAAAMAFAAAEADRASTTLVAVRAWRVPPPVARALSAADGPLHDLEASQLGMLETMLSPVRAEHARLAIDAVTERGRPSLVLAAQARLARLSVVGRHGLEGGAEPGLGPVAHDLLMNMPSPIAIVPETARRST